MKPTADLLMMINELLDIIITDNSYLCILLKLKTTLQSQMQKIINK